MSDIRFDLFQPIAIKKWAFAHWSLSTISLYTYKMSRRYQRSQNTVMKRSIESKPYRGLTATRGIAAAAGAVGAMAIGAFAIGALAIGALAIRKLLVGRAVFKSLHIEELAVTHLRVSELIIDQGGEYAGPEATARR
jgi:hypothetical protein